MASDDVTVETTWNPTRAFQDWVNFIQEELSIYFGDARDNAKKQAEHQWNMANDVMNVAVCGAVKSGKTRLINALVQCHDIKSKAKRNKMDDDPPSSWEMASAPQKTGVPTKYRGDNGITYWEMVGSGQIGSKIESYFSDNNLLAFDMILLLTGDMLREEELFIAKQSKEHKIPFAFVRSKCDRDLKQNAEDNRCEIKKVKAGFLKNSLKSYWAEMEYFAPRHQLFAPCFFVSAMGYETGEDLFKLEEPFLKGELISIREMHRRKTKMRRSKSVLSLISAGQPTNCLTRSHSDSVLNKILSDHDALAAVWFSALGVTP